ncbi:MAG: hypothetical protein GY774_24660 [Planctomycetes bacterium]|nr:hypothetical protein [Planctomycetota bacterium]
MKLEINPKYEPITEKKYCCVPAVLQMIQVRQGLINLSQDEIGSQLGLIVPPHPENLFERVRTGPEAGCGTQTSKEEFSIANYFARNSLPLRIEKLQPLSTGQLSDLIESALQQDCEVFSQHDVSEHGGLWIISFVD